MSRYPWSNPHPHPLNNPGMHGRGSEPSAPASDAVGRGRDAADRASVPRRATWISRLALTQFKLAPTCADSAPTHADSRRTGRIRADSGRIGSYRQNIGVFRPEKGNRPVREKKKKKNLLDWILLRYCCQWTDLLLRVLLCFVF